MGAFMEASRNLGEAIYYSSLAAREPDGDVIAFEALPFQMRRFYIQLAQDAINTARPSHPVLAGKVVGAITPDAPYGVARGDVA